MISACLGSLITSLVVTPFDVIRIRIQQQEIMPASAPCCSTHFPDAIKPPAKLAATSPELFWLHKNYCSTDPNCTRITSTFQGFTTIARNEGVATLWRGLSLTLLMAIPSNIVYFTGYEYIRDHSPISQNPLNPLFCGSFARIMAATLVSPIELVKTRLQSIPSDHNGSPKILANLLKDSLNVVKARGIGTMFTGLQITLWRDVPFSGIYWLSYEFFKERISRSMSSENSANEDDWKVLTSSFLSGSISGLIAAFATNAFDVGKTRLQITSQEQSDKGKPFKKPSMFKFLLDIRRKEGIRALYAGFIPRAIKIAPSCAIMISSYEVGKKLFKNGNMKENVNIN
ncbi:membrane transporter, mitochondrial carrier family [Suhomyces tanzawaensis NRRL Y-17324]|uniref:Mitochondrial thiamine pyrophosphate carrier 1 n=1 Tax=Suhomyces tanzawaensis NRRL Y-17324 TaxID=984487 RepID=A0A1E4SBT8_9ASCO|nr:membrane transporter, mitochondrial carrier family [Suhomyces tanzawaensis NRRL Y-17324]ODV76961.1 membrane transporter, mitochondrial carrier family [Suhomyces tanzawaensis NRRL Y-17324]